MANDLTITGGESAPDGEEKYLDDLADRRPKKRRDGSDRFGRDLIATLQGWWDEARDMHAANRREQFIDVDYYDNHQWDRQTADLLLDRGQAPLTYNHIAPAVDWIIGTERRTRIGWKVHPRGPEDAEIAQAKEQAMKFVEDANDAGFARSEAFSHAVKAGVGWIEECLVDESDDEPITVRCEPWENMWWDPYAQTRDCRDARYITRSRWLDIDYAVSMFPQYEELLRRNAHSYIDTEFDLLEDMGDVPGFYLNGDRYSLDLTRSFSGGFHSTRTGPASALRHRIRLLETWFKRPVPIKRMASLDPDLDRQEYEQDNPKHAAALRDGIITLNDAVAQRVQYAIWIPGQVLVHEDSPYKHRRYPFTPIFCYRDDRTKLPYGVIRRLRDPQDDYNKRRAKALFLLSTNRVIYESDAFEEGDEQDMLDQAAAPNAQIRVKSGALAKKAIQFEWGADLASGQVTLMEQSREHIYEGSGVTRENLGQDTSATSGRAILAKQQQGAVTTAEVFDNLRFSVKASGRKTLSLIEQFMTLPKRIRIIGEAGAMQWMLLNEPDIDPVTGDVIFKNDMAASHADFVVDQQDARETQRMAQAEALFETIRTLPPEAQFALLDVALELTDLPNRADLVARVRQLNGQAAPGEQASPEALAAAQAQAEAQQRASQLEEQERTARIRKDLAAAAKAEADARRTDVETRNKTVEGKRAALDTAAMVQAAIPLAPAADRLYNAPVPGASTTPPQEEPPQ